MLCRYQNKLQANLMKLAEVADKQQSAPAVTAAAQQVSSRVAPAGSWAAVLPGSVRSPPLRLLTRPALVPRLQAAAVATQQAGVVLQGQGLQQLGAASQQQLQQLQQLQQQYATTQGWAAK